MIVIYALSVTLLVFVVLTVILQVAERTWPALTRFLDRHAGQPGPWEL